MAGEAKHEDGEDLEDLGLEDERGDPGGLLLDDKVEGSDKTDEVSDSAEGEEAGKPEGVELSEEGERDDKNGKNGDPNLPAQDDRANWGVGNHQDDVWHEVSNDNEVGDGHPKTLDEDHEVDDESESGEGLLGAVKVRRGLVLFNLVAAVNQQVKTKAGGEGREDEEDRAEGPAASGHRVRETKHSSTQNGI